MSESTHESGAQIRVLLVDDREDQREELAHWLRQSAKFQVDTAGSGEDAIEKARQAQGNYDVVVMDQKLDGMSGIEAMTRLKANDPDLPVIIFTGQEPEAGVEALRKGAYRYLLKLFDPDELVITIRRAADVKTLRSRLVESEWRKALMDVLRELMAPSFSDALPDPPDPVEAKTRVAEKAVQVIHRLTQDDVSLWLHDEAAAQLRVWAHIGLRDEYAEDARLGLTDSVSGKVLRANQAQELFDILDPEQHPRFKYQEEAIRAGWKSVLVTPLFSGKRSLGTLNVYSHVQRHFAQWERELLVSFSNQIASILEQLRLRAMQRMGSEADQPLLVSVTSGMQDVLKSTLARAMELTKTVSGVIHVLDYLEDQVILETSYGYPKKFHHPLPRIVLSREGYTQQIAVSKKRVVVPDTREDPNVNPEVKEEVRSFVGTPLALATGQVVGVLFVNDTSVRQFAEEELASLDVLAKQLAIVIQNLRLYNELRDKVEILSKLNRANQALISAPDLPSTLAGVVKQAQAILAADVVVVYEYDRERKDLRLPPTFVGVNDPSVLKEARKFHQKSVAMELLGAEKRTQYVPNAREEDQARLLQRKEKGELTFVEREGIESSARLRLEAMGEIVGVLFVNYRSPHVFDKMEREKIELLANHVAIAIENARLFQELNDRAAQLEQLQGVTTAILKEPGDVRIALELIVKGLSSTFVGASCAIRLYDSKSDKFEPQVATGILKDFVASSPRPGGTSRYVVKTKAPRYLVGGELTTPPDEGPPVREDILDRGVKAAGYLPLLRKDTAVGILYVDFTVPRQFSQNDRHVLELFADQAAIAIENTRLVGELTRSNEALDRRVKELDALVQVGRVVSNEGIDEVLAQVHDQAARLMDARNLYIAFYDEETDTVSFPLAYSDGKMVETGRGPWASRRRAKPLEAREKRKPGEPRYGLTEYVIARGKGEVSRGSMWGEWETKRHLELSREIPTKSWIGVPLKVWDPVKGAERVVGVISIQSHEKENAYIEDDLRVLELMAGQAAVAIENARLLERETQRAKQLTALQEIGVKITSELELGEVLESIVRNANSILSASFSTLFTYNAERDAFEEGVRKGAIATEPELPSNAGLAARIAKTKKSMFAENEGEEKKLGVKPTIIEEKRGKSFAGVPLVFYGTSVGVLFVNFFKSHSFSKQEKEIMGLLANQAAVAIENARLYAEMEQRVEERTRAWQQEQERADAAEKLALMSNVAAEFAHRMNNLAGTIPVRVAMAKEKLNPDDTRDARIVKQLDSIAVDTKLLLDAAQEIKRSTETRAAEYVDVNEALEIALGRVKNSKPEMEERIQMALRWADDLPQILAERNKLLDTLVSIIQNGVEAMPERGTLTLATRRGSLGDQPCIEIAISDEGVGIPAVDLPKIFDLFFTTKEKGLGFGLWRDRMFVKKLGGDIEVQSIVGSGSTFTIKIPVSSNTSSTSSAEGGQND